MNRSGGRGKEKGEERKTEAGEDRGQGRFANKEALTW